ncbi:MAG TPA: hypothetical protein VE263_04390 [Candidatus Angelobacter sp.]|nr:hypothetical protein [Candidatus Angelobacter sp.]
MRAHQNGVVCAAFAIFSFFSTATGLAQKTPDKSGGDAPRWYNPSRYNPLKLIKREKSANDRLASDGHLEDNLTKQLRLQGILPAETEMQDVCSNFKELTTCVAVLRLTKSLPVEFTCLKWDVTGVKPNHVGDTCAGPAGGKAMSLDKAIDLLKPKVDSRKEAKNALGKAHEDIRDASS